MVLLSAALLAACAPHPGLRMPNRTDGRQWPAPPDPPRVAWVGSLSGGGSGFGRPVDVACGADGVIAVADVERANVQILDLVRGRAHVAAAAAGEPLREPVGVELLGGDLYVVDAARRAVFVAVGARGPLRAVRGAALTRPTDVAAGADGSLFVVDAGAHAVLKLGPEGLLPFFAAHGVAGQGLNYPVRLAVDASGALLVADALNAAVQRVGADGVAFFAGGHGSTGEHLVQPKGIAVDARGRAHVVDAGMQHVQVYDTDGRLAGRYGGPGEGEGELALPGGICIDATSHVFVADSLNRRIQVYSLLDIGEAQP